MPPKPLGAKCEKWSPLNAVKATTMKNASTTSLAMTMTVLERADWRIPEISSAATASTRKKAGMFTSPPSPGGSVIDSLRS